LITKIALLVLVAVNLIAAHALETADLDRLRRRSSRTVIVGTIPQDALPEARMLGNKRPFLDRRQLRESLRRMLDRAVQVLIVSIHCPRIGITPPKIEACCDRSK
jgi:hypothetical protein